MAESSLIVAGLFATVFVLGATWLLHGLLARPDPLAQRVGRIVPDAAGTGPKGDGPGGSGGGGRKSVKETLAEIEDAQRKRRRLTMRLRLRQAGLDWSNRRFYAIAFGAGVVCLLLALGSGLAPLTAGAVCVAGTIALPLIVLRVLRVRRLRQMAEEFPNAVDVIVRGVKSGLPLPDCIAMIAADGREPLAGEFARIVRNQAAGLPTSEAIDRFAARVPLPEANFFAIVIAIQSRTGGRLSDTLGNLAIVLRERKKMKGKIRAMSSEAKASGWIIGSLPVVVGLIVYLTSPDYISLLFTTLIGNVVIIGCLVWMSIGVFVMRRMIAFDF